MNEELSKLPSPAYFEERDALALLVPRAKVLAALADAMGAAPPVAPGEIVKAIREYLGVHPDITLGDHTLDDMALDLARIALGAGAVPAAVAPQGEYPPLPSPSIMIGYGNFYSAEKLRAYFDLGRQAAPALEAPAAPTQGLAIPDDCPHIIWFDDHEMRPVMFAGHGARAAALEKFKRISLQWNAHLFVRIDRNSRDDRFSVAALAAAPQAPAAHSDDAAVDRFAAEMKAKLAAARAKGRGGWEACPPEVLSRMLREHIEKGDPRDVANFCMFLWCLGQPIAAAPAAPAVDAETIHLQDLKNALAECKELRQQLTLMDEQQAGTVWRWQADGQHQLDTMGNRMGVLIYACDLRALLAGAVPAVDASELEWLTKDGRAHGFRVLQTIEGAVITHSTESLRASIAAAQAKEGGEA